MNKGITDIEISEIGIVVQIMITEKNDLELLKENIRFCSSNGYTMAILKIKGCTVDLMVENLTHLFLLGKYIGWDRRDRELDILDLNNLI